MTLINRLLAATIVSFGVASTAGAAILVSGGVYDGTNVGAIDTLIAQGPQLGNPVAETTWVNSVLAALDPPESATFQIKNEPVAYFATNTTDVFAFYMAPPPSEYFLVKNSTSVALYRNLVEANWGVFDTSLLIDGLNLPSDDFEISHVTRFTGSGEPGNGNGNGGGPGNGNGNTVPEPGTLALMGGALFGLWAVRRRKET